MTTILVKEPGQLVQVYSNITAYYLVPEWSPKAQVFEYGKEGMGFWINNGPERDTTLRRLPWRS